MEKRDDHRRSADGEDRTQQQGEPPIHAQEEHRCECRQYPRHKEADTDQVPDDTADSLDLGEPEAQSPLEEDDRLAFSSAVHPSAVDLRVRRRSGDRHHKAGSPLR